jgi:CheY-like chemotaxis protein
MASGLGSICSADEFNHNLIQFRRERADSAEPPAGARKVLVVDDEKLIADTISEILEDAGFRVAVAYDGSAALDVAKGFRPDCVLSDLLMPRMNGVELAIAIRTAYPEARILLFSGQAGISEILLEGRRQGFEFELLAKPIHPATLIERLREQ